MGQETRCQEESNRVVTVPPLCQSVSYAAEQDVALRANKADRKCQVV